MLFLEDDNKTTLVVGIGNAESVVALIERDGTSFHSLGDPNRAGLLQFWCRDQYDDFLAETAIPEADAISAAFEFVRTRARPSGIRLEADW